ncbi:MAG: hypothetical protein PHO63_00710 [Bacilli bacterium]|nr:hypothetical protein [Bacilli bacterium]MDD4809445.1 hypothetical protein [Bacilli bacterium]
MVKKSYFKNHSNEELKEYFNVLCNGDYPSFIDKYINLDELQRLKGVGQFCGVDYNSLAMHNTKYWYSRLDHSVACALIVWHLTNNKTQTLGALFHDVGTPAFAHSIDYMYRDYVKQESSEKSTDEIIKNSTLIKKFLKSDKVSYDDVINIDRFPIVESERPKICVDRLDGILSTGLVWGKFWSLDDIKHIYKSLVILKNSDNQDEIGFDNLSTGEYFYKGAYKYSMLLQLNEDKLSMQLTGDVMKMAIDYQVITIDDLYQLSERDIIQRIKDSDNEMVRYVWSKFENLTKVEKTNLKPVDKYYISIDCKKRNVNPLIKFNGSNYRLTDISVKTQKLNNIYHNFKDTEYAYIDLEPIKILKKER